MLIKIKTLTGKEIELDVEPNSKVRLPLRTSRPRLLRARVR